MHLEPSEGSARNVARPVVDMLFPKQARARIPVFAITGTNGKSTTARMLRHILRAAGFRVGMTTTGGIYINDDRIVKGDASGPKSARLLLQDASIEAAVFETARGGILREGLAYDCCEGAAVVNISADHLGLKGINTLEDLAAVKSVIVEVVSREGCTVLNADDPFTAAMAKQTRGRIVYFSLRSGSDMLDFVRAHIDSGGMARTARNECAPHR
jgi:cyanophycin synthetase